MRARRTKAKGKDSPTASKARKSRAGTAPRKAIEIANDAAAYQCSRHLMRVFLDGLGTMQRDLVRALAVNAAVDAIETWEREKVERARQEFFG